MPFNLTEIDQQLIQKSVLEIKLEAFQPSDGFPSGGNIITFQFPPIMTADSKSAKWNTILNTIAFEPQYMYQGAMPRSIGISTVYVVGGPNGNWTTTRVADEVRRWKSYFYNPGPGAGKTLPIYRIVWHNLLPRVAKDSAWRGINYNVKHSDTTIKDDDGIYPLVTEVNVTLELVSRIRAKDGEDRMPFENLDQVVKQQWY